MLKFGYYNDKVNHSYKYYICNDIFIYREIQFNKNIPNSSRYELCKINNCNYFRFYLSKYKNYIIEKSQGVNIVTWDKFYSNNIISPITPEELKRELHNRKFKNKFNEFIK